MWSVTKIFVFGAVATLMSGAAWAQTQRDNHLYFDLTGVQSFSFAPTEHSIRGGQPWGGVSSGVSRPGAQAFVLVKAGRKRSTGVANWFKERVGGGETMVCNSRGNMPRGLNFAVKGTMSLTVGGQTVTCPDVILAQGNYAIANNWWLGGPGMSGIRASFVGVTTQICRVSGSPIPAVVTFSPQTPCSNKFNISVARASQILPR